MTDRARPSCSSACTTPAARRWPPGSSQPWPAAASRCGPPAREPADQVNPAAVAAMAEVGIDIAASDPEVLTDRRGARPPTSWSRWAAATPARSSRASATRTGCSTTRPAGHRGGPPDPRRDPAPRREAGAGARDLVAPAHREHLERRRERRPRAAGRSARADALEELPRVQVLPAQPVDVRRVRLERRHAGVERVGGVDPVRRRAGSRTPRPARTPPHGSSPSVELVGKTQRLPASRTASSTARPVAMWSAWLRLRPPQVSRKLPVITISGRCRRTDGGERAAQRHAVLQDAVGLLRGTRRSSTPTIRADSICSASRTRRHSSGSMPSMPASPLVTMQ